MLSADTPAPGWKLPFSLLSALPALGWRPPSSRVHRVRHSVGALVGVAQRWWPPEVSGISDFLVSQQRQLAPQWLIVDVFSLCDGATPIPEAAMGLHSPCGDSSLEGGEETGEAAFGASCAITEGFPLWWQFPTQHLRWFDELQIVEIDRNPLLAACCLLQLYLILPPSLPCANISFHPTPPRQSVTARSLAVVPLGKFLIYFEFLFHLLSFSQPNIYLSKFDSFF